MFTTVGEQSIAALEKYSMEVKSGKFPVSPLHTYKMSPGEAEKLNQWIIDRAFPASL